MAQTLHDHQRRLHDLEAALEAVLWVATSPPTADKRSELAEAVRKLRARGEKGAAELLLGEGHRAVYRR